MTFCNHRPSSIHLRTSKRNNDSDESTKYQLIPSTKPEQSKQPHTKNHPKTTTNETRLNAILTTENRLTAILSSAPKTTTISQRIHRPIHQQTPHVPILRLPIQQKTDRHFQPTSTNRQYTTITVQQLPILQHPKAPQPMTHQQPQTMNSPPIILTTLLGKRTTSKTVHQPEFRQD